MIENKTLHKTENCIAHKDDNPRGLRVRWCDVRRWICIGITILVYFLITYGLAFADCAQGAVDTVVDGVPRAFVALSTPSGLFGEPQHDSVFSSSTSNGVKSLPRSIAGRSAQAIRAGAHRLLPPLHCCHWVLPEHRHQHQERNTGFLAPPPPSSSKMSPVSS